MAVTINKDTVIGELLQIDIGTAAILMAEGMHCIGCPSSIGETLEEACWVHGMEVEPLVEKINDYLANKED